MRILVIGGDKRMDYAAEKLSEQYETEQFQAGDTAAPGRFGAVVLPLPLTKNGSDIFAPALKEPLGFEIIGKFAEEGALIFAGGESKKLSDFCAEHKYRLENYFSHETLTLRNAALTAEAACAMLSQSTDGALLNSRVLITGYGRIARFLAARLKANGCAATVAARRAEQRETAVLDGFSAVSVEDMSETLANYDLIANTVPFALFTEKDFRLMRGDCVFIELATLPEQPVRSFADSCGIKYIYASGLPGKCSPKAAGIYIAEEITGALKRISDIAQLARPTT
ncbi:MAG: hypothetical protein K2N56_03420 [Oscillospiraceae bacterium]|nr:hypothetical protein [Oscillospiraceae bacterium]